MSRKRFLDNAAAIMALYFSGMPAFATKLTGQLNQGWLKKDMSMVTSTTEVLAKPLSDVDQFLLQIKPSDIRDDRSIGFGLRQIRCALYGGYTTIWISLAVLDKTIVALECSQSGGNPETWARVTSALHGAWKQVPVESDDMSITIMRFVDKQQIDKALSPELGSMPHLKAADACEKSFNLLMSPLEALHVGESCYVDGQRPAGRKAMNELTAAGRDDLVRAVLRGPSPEGRTYAALALRKENKCTAEDTKVIDKLSKLDIKIWVCTGCMLSRQTFTEILNQPAVTTMPKHFHPF